MDGLALVLKVYQSLQALFAGPSPAPAMLAAGMGGAGSGGDDDGDDDDSPIETFEQEPLPELSAWAPVSLAQLCLEQRQRLLSTLRKKMQWAQTRGNRDLVRILRDRIMLVEIDRDLLQHPGPHSASLSRLPMQEWLIRDSQEIQQYAQSINVRGCQASNFFPEEQGRQAAGSGGNAASGAGATSKPAGQAGMVTRKNGIASHQLSPVTLDDKGDEREEDNDPPPIEKAHPEFAATISCRLCQKTLNEQEVSRILRGSTAESVLCDACLHSVAQASQRTGKGKAVRKRARPAQAKGGHIQPQQKIPRLSDKGPEEGRSHWDYTIQTQEASQTQETPSEKRAGKRKRASHPQNKSAAKKVRLDTREPTTGSAEPLELLNQLLAFEMNEQERQAANQLFEQLNGKNLRIKPSLYKLLAKVDRNDFSTGCAKASVFFGSLTPTIKDTGCLTSMLSARKKHIRDFLGRENSELEYLAGLETLRALSSMNNGKGLPDEAKVKAMLDWPVWKVDGQFSMELFRALSSMNNGKGLPPDEAKVKAMLDWPVWKVDGQFSMELFRALSSMNNGKGLPAEAEVKAMLDWPVWKVDGQFSMELFRALSSMNSSRGLPDEAKVKAMLDWPVWKVDGQFSMELFRALSSMNSSRGLPDEAKVKAMLDWPVWKVDGQFSMELFRALSSMNNGKGLPPDEAKVKAMLDWPVWKVDGQFSMELFRALSSMNNGKGLPDKAEVKAMLDWPVWKVDGQFSMELFRALSCMNNGKGLPDEAKVKAMLGWLNCGKCNDGLQSLMVRLYAKEGMPDTKKAETV